MRSANPDLCGSVSRGPMWIAALVTGVVLYLLLHDPEISTVEHYAPWAATTSTFASNSTGARGIAYALVGLLGVGFALREPTWPRVDGLLPALMLAFCGWACASIVWSAEVRVTAIRLAVLLITCVGAYGLSRGLARQRWLELAVVVTSTWLLIGLAAELKLGTFRPWSAEHRFAGTLHPNAQGASLSILSLAAYCQLRWNRPRHWRWAALFLIALIFLILTRSRTACSTLLLALCLTELLLAPPLQRASLGLGAACCAALLAFAIGLSGISLEDEAAQLILMGRVDEADEFNGRQPVWEALIPYAQTRPWTGYGYESFWTQDHIESVQNAVRWPVRDAHSAYINTVLGVGIIGTVLYLAMLLCALGRATSLFRQQQLPADALMVGLVLLFLFSGFLEANASPPGFEILLLCSGLARIGFPRRSSESRWDVVPAQMGPAVGLRPQTFY